MPLVEQVGGIRVGVGFKRCSACGRVKPLSEFYRRKGTRDGHTSQCKACRKAHRDKIMALNQLRVEQGWDPHEGEVRCPRCGLVLPGTLFYINLRSLNGLSGFCIGCHGEAAKLNHLGYKKLVFDHYGRVCVGCGETDEATLTIDHIKGGGNAHRKKIGKEFYKWLVDQGFPKDFRTLCMSCQFRAKYGHALPLDPDILGARHLWQRMIWASVAGGGPVTYPLPPGYPLPPRKYHEYPHGHELRPTCEREPVVTCT
jgi:hypothetical protein